MLIRAALQNSPLVDEAQAEYDAKLAKVREVEKRIREFNDSAANPANGFSGDIFEGLKPRQEYIDTTEAAQTAHEVLETAKVAHLLCMVFHLTAEVTGPCGHTYMHMDEGLHAEVTGMCGHTYYYCIGGHGYISLYPCSKCGSYYFTCWSDSCIVGGIHH